MAKVDNVVFSGTPGSTFKVSFDGNGIDQDKPIN